jgi:integrase
MAEPIKKGTKPDGATYYWFRVEVGRDPITGKRRQKYQQFDKMKDAKAEYAKISHEVGKGSYIHESDLTVADYLEAWAANRCRDKSAATKRTYVDSFRPVRELLGARRLQTVTQKDVEAVVEWMTTVGRKRGGKAGTPLSPRSVQMMLSHLRAALADAVDDGLIVRNVARKVRGPKLDPAPIVPWTDTEVKAFLTAIKGDRLYPVMRLSLTALRPSEVCGLRWASVDLKAKTLTVRRVRTLVMGEAVEKEPKSKAGGRALPLDDATAAALEAFKAQQGTEKAVAGDAYEDLGYVLVRRAGGPGRGRLAAAPLQDPGEVRRGATGPAIRRAARLLDIPREQRRPGRRCECVGRPQPGVDHEGELRASEP